MGDLLETNKPMYMLLPLDEAPFVVNANARSVSIPAEFAKCGAVKGDNYCEIATFVIDRYFDYKDLAEANIAVQWVNANNEEGISHIQLIDLESEEGKIRFGWPLVESITKYPGQVKFAIRFFVPSETEANKFDYLLNTLPSVLTVKDGLNVINPKHIHENDYNEFRSFVKNSQNPAYVTPASPFFTEVNGGIDLDKYAAIDLDTNTLKLEAQAVAADLGDITYKWFYVPAGSEFKEEIAGGDGVYEVKLYEYVKVDLIVDEEGKVTNSKGLDKYWVKTGSDEADSYELYTGEWPPAADAELYEIVTSLAFEDKEVDIVGEYWVEAINTIGTNSVNPVASTHCVIPAPNKMVYTKDLKNHVFAVAPAAGQAVKADLAIELKEDKNEPVITYAWYKSTTGVDGDFGEAIPGADTASYSAAEAGWYKAVPVARLNRKVESEESNICKVTMKPEPPVIEKLSYKLKTATEYAELLPDETMADVYANGDIIYLKVETDLDDAADLGLLSEGLTYTWYVQEPDKVARKLAESDIGLNHLLDMGTVLNSNEIRVRCRLDGKAYNYFCVITNTIQGETASVDSTSYNTFIIA